jgi:hypothetical protein
VGAKTEIHPIVELASGTAEVATQLRTIIGVSITQVGAVAVDEGFSLNETQDPVTGAVNAGGGNVTIDSSEGTSTATVCVVFWGY